MAKNKEVAVKNEYGLPAELADEMALDAGAGQEDITAADVSIPFLRILQQMSPQCIRSKGEYIDSAQAGQIFNTVTGELWAEDNGPIIVPCAYNFKYIGQTVVLKLLKVFKLPLYVVKTYPLLRKMTEAGM